jgi:hypothetical protein
LGLKNLAHACAINRNAPLGLKNLAHACAINRNAPLGLKNLGYGYFINTIAPLGLKIWLTNILLIQLPRWGLKSGSRTFY